MSVKLTLKARMEIREQAKRLAKEEKEKMIQFEKEKNIKRNKEILNIMEQVAEAQLKEETLITQDDICTTIKNNIKKNASIKLEQEETLEDGSVVITINV